MISYTRLLIDDFCGQLFVEQSGVHGEQGLVASVLDGAFAVAMDEDGTLFGLDGRDAADVNECLDDIVESMHVVIIQDKTTA